MFQARRVIGLYNMEGVSHDCIINNTIDLTGIVTK